MSDETNKSAASESVVSTHTPGPWAHGHLGFDKLWIGPSHEDLPVAVVPWDCANSRGNARDNARLIAAAPDLLDALTDLVEFFDGYQGRRLNAARAAIAKATGGQS